MREMLIAVLGSVISFGILLIGCEEPLPTQMPPNTTVTPTIDVLKADPLMIYEQYPGNDVVAELWRPSEEKHFPKDEIGAIVVKLTFQRDEARNELYRRHFQVWAIGEHVELLNAHRYVPHEYGGIYHLNQNDEVLIPFRFLKGGEQDCINRWLGHVPECHALKPHQTLILVEYTDLGQHRWMNVPITGQE